MRCLRRVAVTVATVVLTSIVAGCDRDCIRAGPSAVSLTVPVGWEVTAFCIDARCLSPSELVPLDSAPANEPSDYFIEVSDAAIVYEYRFEVTSTDGSVFARHGKVATVGYLSGGETCRPTQFGAGLRIGRSGQVTGGQP